VIVHVNDLTQRNSENKNQRNRKRLATSFNEVAQCQGFLQIERHRFVAHHVKTRFQKCGCHREMEVIWRHDRDKIDALSDGSPASACAIVW
jgi:hypothetical protein